jgi:hypothetical protein
MTLTAKSPEQLKADRLAREAKETEAAAERFLAQRAQWSGWFQILGGLLMLIGLWVLLFSPGLQGEVVNLQKLYIGQTSALVGAILFTAGVLLKFAG